MMKVFLGVFWFSTAFLFSEEVEPALSLEDGLQALAEARASVGSYIAKYECGSKGKPSIEVNIVFHQKGEMSLIEMKEIGATERGMLVACKGGDFWVDNPKQSVRYENFLKSFRLIFQLFSSEVGLEKKEPNFRPHLWLTQKEAVTGVEIYSEGVDSEGMVSQDFKSLLPPETKVEVNAQEVVFSFDSDKSFRFGASHGVLLSESYPSSKRARDVTLFDLKLNPSADEVGDFIQKRLPQDFDVEAAGKEPQILQALFKIGASLIHAVDEEKITPEMLQEQLQEARPRMNELVSVLLPNGHEVIRSGEEWEAFFTQVRTKLRDSYQKKRLGNEKLPEWEKARGHLEQGIRWRLRETVTNVLKKKFKIEEAVPVEMLKAETDEATIAVQILLAEVQRAVIEVATESALNEYWGKE